LDCIIGFTSDGSQDENWTSDSRNGQFSQFSKHFRFHFHLWSLVMILGIIASASIGNEIFV